MKTPLELDDDVVTMLRQVQDARGMSLPDVVNAGLRLGLPSLLEAAPPVFRHLTASMDLGACLIGSLDDVSAALAIAEGH